ncbi:GPI-linked NAD(P)(+)--arginine ADP-ribosyltransferase 1-like isoform X2 [Hyperolius riggenbachi]|uniref:GPI-linked NAD(P)(+)--arginine ADP-ribosyltransferase 1-like isoform X2 n=1 Tax=Hyperolius riggenbachi TaxID=752182 RepID=UPI0035A2C850
MDPEKFAVYWHGVRVLLTKFVLNMNEHAFDDQYDGCTVEMENEILSSLLNEEKATDSVFRDAWDKAAQRWQEQKLSVPEGFKDEYGIAIMAYTNIESSLYSNFNAAVRKYDPNTFHYHSMHFFLTRAVVLLNSQCQTVYRGMKGVHLNPEAPNAEVRFGQFSSSSKNKKISEDFGKDTFIKLFSCFGIDVRRFSYVPEQEEVLIPVDEVFRVKDTKTVDGDKSYLELESAKKRCHYYNCEYLKKGGQNYVCMASEGTRIPPSLAMILLLLCGLLIF